ncbi:MAG: hypothetical protein AAF662_13320 [Pseudomonadota bacterium]
MDDYPEEHELIGFFESEARVTDRDVPPFYNRHTYSYQRDGDSVVCSIEPGYRQIDLTWRRDGHELGSFALRDIRTLSIDGAPGEESMKLQFLSEYHMDFVLFLKPTVRIEWGNEAQINR